jgi:hypothetical protein
MDLIIKNILKKIFNFYKIFIIIMEFKKLINQVNNIDIYYNSKTLVVNKGNILPIDQTQQEPEINYKFEKINIILFLWLIQMLLQQ